MQNMQIAVLFHFAVRTLTQLSSDRKCTICTNCPVFHHPGGFAALNTRTTPAAEIALLGLDYDWLHGEQVIKYQL